MREVIVFVEDQATAASPAQSPDGDDIFADMHPHMVDVADVDDSREAIYSRMEGE